MHQGLAVLAGSFTQFGSAERFESNKDISIVGGALNTTTEDEYLPPFQVERRKPQEQKIVVQERERQRIAMELHDGLGQALTLMKLELMNATSLLPDDAHGYSDAKQSLQRLRLRLHYAFDELRRTVSDLRPAMLDDLGILPTLSWFFREFEASAKEIVLVKEISVLEHQVPAQLKITIFRILQESFSNAVKHAGANRIYVEFKQAENRLALTVEDNGQGFDPAQKGIFQRSGGGVAGIIERVRVSGGEWLIESEAGRGTRIGVSWDCTWREAAL